MVGLSSFTRVAALWLAFVAAVWVGIGQRAEAQNTYYWDSNGATAGFGNTNGQWGSSFFWSTNASGTVPTPSLITTGTLDALNFGTATDGYLGTSVTTSSGTVTANSITVGSASIGTLSIGAFTLGGINPRITVNNAIIGVGVLAGSNGLIKSGTGQLNLRSANTWTGGLTIQEGAVFAGNQQANIPLANTITLGDPNGGTASAKLILQNNGNNIFGNPIVLGKSSGQLALQVDQDGTSIHSKTFSGGVTGTNNLTLINNGNNQLMDFTTNAVNNVGSITNIGPATSSTTRFTSAIGSNVTNFVQNSASNRVIFQNAMTYTGSTIITAGTISLMSDGVGSFNNSPTIIVGSGGASAAVLDLTGKTTFFDFLSTQTVGGTGTINRGTNGQGTVRSFGIWAPGNSIGSNSVIGSLTLGGTSRFELGTPGTSTSSPGTSDRTAVSGTLTLGGALQLVDNAGADGNGSAAGGVYRLFTYGGISGSYSSVTPTANTRTSLSNITYGGSGTGAGQGVFLSLYSLASNNSITGTVSLGNIRSGGSFTGTSISIWNTSTAAATGFQEGLSAVISGSTGQATGSGSIANLITGTSNDITAGLSAGSAGAKNGTITVQFQSTGTTTTGATGLSAINVGTGTVTMTGTVWNPAAPNQLPSTVSLGTILKGGTSSSLLSITNTAANDGFSEKLNASFGTLSGVTSNSGTINLLAAGSTDNSALQVYLTKATAGQASGTAQVNFWTDGQGTSGLAPAQLTSQSVTYTGTFLDPAVASFNLSGSTTLALSFGTVNEGDTVSPLSFSLYNLMQTNGYTADLALVGIVETGSGGPLTTNLTTFNSLASGTFNTWQANVSTLTQGTYSNTWTLTFKSSNNGSVYTEDSPQTLTFTTSVIVVPEPRTLALAGVGLALAAWARRFLKRG